MNIIFQQCHSANFKAGRTSKIRYIVIHYTANNGDTAKNNVDYYSNNKAQASAHYFVDEYDTVYQSVRDEDTAWAVGGTTAYKHPYCRNDNSISIELCSRNRNGKGKSATDNGWYFKEQTVKNAAELTGMLMAKYNIPVENVIRHYDVWEKICPAPFVNNPAAWNDFKEALKVNQYSYDNTVENMILDGITTAENMGAWEKMLDGREPLNKDYVRAVLDRYHEKVSK
jgi:N-acetylmuramoyl-L-alanine amidase CwlA